MSMTYETVYIWYYLPQGTGHLTKKSLDDTPLQQEQGGYERVIVYLRGWLRGVIYV
jgi:hypothetical protein